MCYVDWSTEQFRKQTSKQTKTTKQNHSKNPTLLLLQAQSNASHKITKLHDLKCIINGHGLFVQSTLLQFSPSCLQCRQMEKELKLQSAFNLFCYPFMPVKQLIITGSKWNGKGREKDMVGKDNTVRGSMTA